MNHRIYFCLVLPVILFYLPVSGQGVQQGQPDLSHDHTANLGEYMMDYRHLKRSETGDLLMEYDDIIGSPYYHEDFVEGQIVMNSGQIFESPLRLNLYTEQIELRAEDGSSYSVSDPKNIKYIIIGEQKFLYLPSPHDLSKTISMESLYEGKFSLLLKRSVKFQDLVPPQPYVEYQAPRFVKNDDELFLLHPELGYVEIRSRKSLLNALPDKGDELKAYIKKEKLDPVVPGDMVKILEYYHQ